MKIFLIVGEASGDVLGSKLLASLKKQILQNPDFKNQKLELVGIGGPMMIKEGLPSLFDIQELSLMGFVEIVPHIPKLLKRINQTAQEIITQKPDLIITIDSPDFCFRVIKKIIKNKIGREIKKIHYIAPTVWAYRPKRAEKIAKLFDLLLVILPFEPPYFEKYGLKTTFVGHPITEKEHKKSKNNFKKKHDIAKNDILLCLTPGSRFGEIKRIFPEMIDAVNILAPKYPNLVVAIPTLGKTYDLIKSYLYKLKVKTILVNQEEKRGLFLSSDFAIAKSGTNSLELAMYELPMIVTYKTNFLTYLMVKMMANVKFANLINLIFNKEVIPEMIQGNCKGYKLAAKLEELISNPLLRKNQVEMNKTALMMLGLDSKEKPSDKAAQAVLEFL